MPEDFWVSLIFIVVGPLLMLFSGRSWRWLDRKGTEWYPWLSKIMLGAYDEKTKRVRGWQLIDLSIWVSRAFGLLLLISGALLLHKVLS